MLDKRYLIPMAICAIIGTFGLIASPAITGYPFVWIARYAYVVKYEYPNFTHPKPIIVSQKEGESIVSAVIQLAEVTDSWKDYLPIICPEKTPFIGLDNIVNAQLATLNTIRTTSHWLRYFAPKKDGNGTENSHLVQNQILWGNDSSALFMPNATMMYNKGTEELKLFLEDVRSGRSHIYGTASNADELLKNIASNLSTEAEALRGDISWLQLDDVYYHAQETLRSDLFILKAMQVDFKQVLETRMLQNQFAEIIRDAESNEYYLKDPLIVTGGSFGIANDLVQLATPIQKLSAALLTFPIARN